MKINKKNIYISLQQFLPLSEAEIQGLLHPAQANLEYLQLPSVQFENPLAFKFRVSFLKYVLKNKQSLFL
jgi:hypothetical protein